MMLIDNNDDNDNEIEEITIGQYKLIIIAPENDFNSNKKTLFATIIWSGSRILSEYLIRNDIMIKDKCCIEFGAAIGIPSLICGKLGASFICATDYPSECVLQSLNNNINTNYYNDDNKNKKNFIILPHIWGEDTSPLLQPLQTFWGDQNAKYDVALSCECLWKHENHSSLVNSIVSVLKVKGILLLTYSHHMPGLEENDDNFINLLIEKNFKVIHNEIVVGNYQWDMNQQKYVIIIII